MMEKQFAAVPETSVEDIKNELQPGEQPVTQETPPFDDAPVSPLTEPDDTEGG